jgi:hypothetical protein
MGRNFAMNPQNVRAKDPVACAALPALMLSLRVEEGRTMWEQGVKVKAFKHALRRRETDVELFHLCKYLLDVAQVPDVTVLNHRVRLRLRLHQRGREMNCMRSFSGDACRLGSSRSASPTHRTQRVLLRRRPLRHHRPRPLAIIPHSLL